MMRWTLGAAAAGALLLSACAGDEDGPTSRIFVAPTWDGPERLEYELYRGDDDLYGTCTMESAPGPDASTLVLRSQCTDPDDAGNRDDTEVVVDAATLQPIRSERVRASAEQESTTTVTAEYNGDTDVLIHFKQVDWEDESDPREFETRRDLPQPDDESPEPGWYDEASLFWLMRGIPLEEGWDGAYANLNLGIARLVVVDVEVDGQDEIEVPAGTFETWTVRMDSSVTNRFWVDVEAPHRVVQARLEDVRFELVSAE